MRCAHREDAPDANGCVPRILTIAVPGWLAGTNRRHATAALGVEETLENMGSAVQEGDFTGGPVARRRLHPWVARTTASMVRSASASVVDQLLTLMRIAARPLQRVLPAQMVPSAWMRSITRAVCGSGSTP